MVPASWLVTVESWAPFIKSHCIYISMCPVCSCWPPGDTRLAPLWNLGGAQEIPKRLLWFLGGAPRWFLSSPWHHSKYHCMYTSMFGGAEDSLDTISHFKPICFTQMRKLSGDDAWLGCWNNIGMSISKYVSVASRKGLATSKIGLAT